MIITNIANILVSIISYHHQPARVLNKAHLNHRNGTGWRNIGNSCKDDKCTQQRKARGRREHWEHLKIPSVKNMLRPTKWRNARMKLWDRILYETSTIVFKNHLYVQICSNMSTDSSFWALFKWSTQAWDRNNRIEATMLCILDSFCFMPNSCRKRKTHPISLHPFRVIQASISRAWFCCWTFLSCQRPIFCQAAEGQLPQVSPISKIYPLVIYD